MHGGHPVGTVWDMDKTLRIIGFRFSRDTTMTRSKAITLACLVVLTQLGDFLSTYIGVTLGAAEEANPLMIWAMSHGGWLAFAAVKLAAAALMLWLTWKRFGASVAFIAIYTAIVAWNTYVTLTGL